MKKFFYALGTVLIGGSIFITVTDSSIAGFILGVCGLLVVGATFFASKLIDAGTQTGFDGGTDGNMSVEMKINQAISGARQNKFKAESEIRRLTAWSNDAIFTAYHAEYEKVKVNYPKDTLLDNYNEIRENYAPNLSFETMEKCDGIVKDYKQKIDGYKERIDLFLKQEDEYKQLKNKIKAVKQHEKLMNKLDSHQGKLESASEKEAQSIVAGDSDLAGLTMDSIAKEVAEKEEYFKQLDQLNFQLKQ